MSNMLSELDDLILKLSLTEEERINWKMMVNYDAKSYKEKNFMAVEDLSKNTFNTLIKLKVEHGISLSGSIMAINKRIKSLGYRICHSCKEIYALDNFYNKDSLCKNCKCKYMQERRKI
mgnify:CR=1 FL=1